MVLIEIDWFDEAVAADIVLPEILASSSDDVAEIVDSDNEGGDLKEALVVEERGGVNVEEFSDMLGEVFVVAESAQTAGMAELYDSGCTNHISPTEVISKISRVFRLVISMLQTNKPSVLLEKVNWSSMYLMWME